MFNVSLMSMYLGMIVLHVAKIALLVMKKNAKSVRKTLLLKMDSVCAIQGTILMKI